MKLNKLNLLFNPGIYGQWIIVIILSGSIMACSMAFGWSSPALLKIRNGEAGFNLTLTEQSWMVSATFIGNIITPILSAYLMDSNGRLFTLMISIIPTILMSWILIIFTKTSWCLYISRFLAGCWGGIVYTVIPLYTGEVVSPEIRGIVGSIYGASFYIGLLFEGAIGSWVSYEMLGIISALIPLLLFTSFFFIPESPHYYLLKGKRFEAERSLKWLKRKNVLSLEKDLINLEKAINEELKNSGSFIDIFNKKENLKAIVIVVIIVSIQRMSGLTILLSYASVVMPDSILSPEQSGIALSIVWLVSTLIFTPFIERYGKKLLLAVSCIGCSISMCLASAWYFLRDFSEIDVSIFSWLPLLLFTIHGIFFAFGLVPVPITLQGEMFSMNIKTKASALSTVSLNFFSALVTNIFLTLEISVGVYMNFVICACASTLGAITALTIMIETKGKTLEEIQINLKGNKKIVAEQINYQCNN